MWQGLPGCNIIAPQSFNRENKLNLLVKLLYKVDYNCSSAEGLHPQLRNTQRRMIKYPQIPLDANKIVKITKYGFYFNYGRIHDL